MTTARSEQPSPSLTEFLLARIAEDEAPANYALTRDDVGERDWAGWWFGHQRHYSRHDPVRVLAECEAKRQIVECATNMHTSGPDWDEAVRLLALPYADHPDYCEGWKP